MYQPPPRRSAHNERPRLNHHHASPRCRPGRRGRADPVYVHVVDHPDARVLVDTGMTELHPAVADLDPGLRPLSKQDFALAGIDIVVNTHLHSTTAAVTTSSPDGRFTFSGRSSRTRARRTTYTIREWVEAPGVRYVSVDGKLELLSGSGSSRHRAPHPACRWS